MFRSTSIFFVFLAAILGLVTAVAEIPEGEDGYIEPTYNGVNMSFVRMCAAFHCEGCSPFTDPPGPCLSVDECLDIVCHPSRPAGSCTANPNHSFCENFNCKNTVRQQANFLGRMSLRLFGQDSN